MGTIDSHHSGEMRKSALLPIDALHAPEAKNTGLTVILIFHDKVQ
jgi:hypothetical protein